MTREQIQCAVWDFRCGQETISVEELKEFFRKWAKKWVFQLERGEQTGYIHFQGRFSLSKKKRKSELMSVFQAEQIEVPEYLEPTSKQVAEKDCYFYPMKPETRVIGPYSDKDKEIYIPRQFRGKLETLYPFQKQIWDSKDVFDDRTINLIYCPKGNNGKSVVAHLCRILGKGIVLPPLNDAEKLIQACCDIAHAKEVRDPSPIFIDLPRAMNKERLNGIYTAVEQIKGGNLFDVRYHYKEWDIDSPQIWVFTNIKPDITMLSRDRWVVWNINDNRELERYHEQDAAIYDVTEQREIQRGDPPFM